MVYEKKYANGLRLIVKNMDGKDVILTQTGEYFGAIGKMTIAADGTYNMTVISGYDE